MEKYTKFQKKNNGKKSGPGGASGQIKPILLLKKKLLSHTHKNGRRLFKILIPNIYSLK